MNDNLDDLLTAGAGNQPYDIAEATLAMHPCPIRDVARGLHNPRGLGQLLVSQGAGIVGRPIPGPDGRTVLLDGFISEIDVGSLLDGSSSCSAPSGKSEATWGATP